jgi:hypothetical protein
MFFGNSESSPAQTLWAVTAAGEIADNPPG